MQGKVSLESGLKQGDGIYKKAQTTNEDETNELLLLQSPKTDTSDLDDDLDENHNQVVEQINKLENESATIDNILNVLSKQLEHLNELKQTKTKSCNQQSYQSPSGSTKSISIETSPNLDHSFKRKRSPQNSGSNNSQTSKRSSALTRKFLLDNYIESSIKDNENDCDCHYHLQLSEQLDHSLDDELHECYREANSPEESTGGCSLEEVLHDDHDCHTQQVNDDISPGGLNLESLLSEYASEVDIDCRNLATSALSSGNNRVGAIAAYSRCACFNHNEIGDGSVKRVSHTPLNPAFSQSRNEIYEHNQRSSERDSLFIESESVQSLRRREIRANGLGQACLSALNSNKSTNCNRSESNPDKVNYGQQQRQQERAKSVECVSLANIEQTLPGLNNFQSLSEGGLIRECRCCCHHHHHHLLDNSSAVSLSESSLTTTDSYDEDEDDLDPLFDIRSALESVEDSPPNNEFPASSTSVNDYRDQRKETILEPQLYCSLTIDSTASRQDSPLDPFVEPSLFDEQYCPSVDSINSGLEISQLESFIWSELHKMDTDESEDNSCKSKHNTTSKRETYEDQHDLNQFAQIGVGNVTGAPLDTTASGLILDEAHVNNCCDHKREKIEFNLTESNGNRPTTRVELDNYEDNNNCGRSQTNNNTTHFDSSDLSQRDADLSLQGSSVTGSNSSSNKADNVSVSMKAAKDLVKLSIPSLSSLQYLPNQLEMKPTRMIDQTCSQNKTTTQQASVQNGEPNLSSTTTTNNMIEQIDQVTKPTEEQRSAKTSSKPDEPCLLHRLCLCNCMARDHSDVSDHKAALRRQKQSSASSGSSRKHRLQTEIASGVLASSASSSGSQQDESSKRKTVDARSQEHCSRVSPSRGLGRKNLVEAAVSMRNDEDIPDAAEGATFGGRVTKEFSVTVKDVEAGFKGRQMSEERQKRAEARAEERKVKQSQGLLSLLRPTVSRMQNERIENDYENVNQVTRSNRKSPTSRGAVKNLRGHHHQHSKQTLNLERGSLLVGSDGLGSIGDLEASGRSSSASGTNSDVCSPLSGSNERSDESSSYKSGRRSADILSFDEASESVRQINKSPLGKQTNEKNKTSESCNCCKQQTSLSSAQHKRRLKSFRKLLMPNKLFGSTSSICEHLEPEPNQQQQQDPSCESKSFLSRSLSRLGGRKKKSSNQSGRDKSNKPSDLQISSDCTSPDASISANSQPDTFSDSVNSLEDELCLTYSLPFDINREQSIHEPNLKQSTRILNAPKIVLSKVEYHDVESANCSCDGMTRSTGGGSFGGHGHSRVMRNSNRNHDNRGNEDRQPPPSPNRCGSELSISSANQVKDSLANGPFSMPSSPRLSRRKHHPKSPRLSQSPVSFHSPASESTKIEDGLKVCSTEHFEKHIGNIKDDQIEVQKQLFTAWINHFVPNLIRKDLFDELKDGIKLICLLATLTRDRDLMAKHERLMRDKQTYVNRLVLSPSGQMRNISNVSYAINYLKNKLDMKLINLSPMDIVNGKANVILGLCWNLILHFQLDRDLLNGGSESSSQNSDSMCTSPLSPSSTNGDRTNRNLFNRRQSAEFTAKDLARVRTKLLDHINKRCNLKLTNLTSSLVDGDVLLAIIKHLLTPCDKFDSPKWMSAWNNMTDDEKLDHCFELANEHLNVPKLISASDLRKQTISENNSKPLLVYLSMLLKSNPRNCSTDQMLELRQLDASLKEAKQVQPPTINIAEESKRESKRTNVSSAATENLDTKDKILAAIDVIDSGDRFHVHKLQTTIARIDHIDKAIKTLGVDHFDQATLDRFHNLKRQANQIEFLISWINKADQLFELKQKSSGDLARTIEEYQNFFEPSSLPQIDETLCPTLERQYRECLATARQRVLSMEQTMKNWISYEQARQDLRNWLKTAEAKLTDSLRPDSSNQSNQRQQSSPKQDVAVDPVAQYSCRLDDLIEYFELESVEIDEFDRANCSFLSSSIQDEVSTSSLNNSLSGSLLSLGSNTSRFSAVASSKKATYGRLFDNFELKCRLLAAMLEPEQRDSLLVGVKELKSRLKYIIDCKVPQVINEVRLSIERCEMSIMEQDEVPSELEEEALNQEPILAEPEAQISERNLVPMANQPPVCSSDECVTPSPPDEKVDDLKSVMMTKKRNKTRNKAKLSSKKAAASKKANTSNTTLVNQSKTSSCADRDGSPIPYHRVLWDKICRASKMSLSFNIVLLICLAGVCIIPLFQRDACCELNQTPVASDRFTINQKPT